MTTEIWEAKEWADNTSHFQAISLAILVGTSVDYCVHLVEGYRIAGKTQPPAEWDGSVRGEQSETLSTDSRAALMNS